MLGKLISIENGPERDVEIVVSRDEVRSAISDPVGSIDPSKIDRYELSGVGEHDTGLVTLTIVLTDNRRIQFYRTESKFDLVLLLDQLDGTIGERPRITSLTRR